MEWFSESSLTTACPYKVGNAIYWSSRINHLAQGVANYYNVRLPDGTALEDSIWWYRNANPECIQIQGLIAFYDERFDVYVDGEKQER